MHCRTCGPRRKRWAIRSRSCERLEELALIGAPMSSQRPSAVDLLVSSEVSREVSDMSGGDERRPVAQAVEFGEIEKSLRELRSGRMIVIADDEDRENEGDLMIAAEMVTPEVINFMATYARGLICLAMTGERLDRLELGPMVLHNTASRRSDLRNHEPQWQYGARRQPGKVLLRVSLDDGDCSSTRSLQTRNRIKPTSGPASISGIWTRRGEGEII